MSKQLILFQIIFVGLFWVGSSATAYLEDFEDAGNLDGTVYGPTENAPPVVSGGMLWTDYVDSGFIANGDYADFSGYMTFNFGGSTDAWKEAVYVIGTDGSNGAPNFAGAISGVLVQYLPDKGWLYILQSWKGGGIWSTVYLEQSGMVNPAGFSNTTDYELHVVDNGDSTLDAWVQEAANPANKGHVYEDIDISGATFYGDKVAVSGNSSPGVGGIDDLFIGTSDDFEDGVINTGKWMVSGDGVTESSGTLNVLRGSGYDSSVISNATVLPDVEQTVLLSTSNVDYTSYGSGGAFGFNTAAGDFTKGIMLLQKDDQFEYVYMANGGPAQILKIGNKTYFHGSFEFLWSTDKVVIKKNGLTVFDSYDPVYNGGISWDIPEGPLHAYLRSCLSDAAHGGIYEDVKLELAYTPVANVALHKPYRINQIPIDILDSYMDTQGSQPFTQTHSWYTGELTNGATGSTSSSDYEWVYFSPSGRNSVILDLGAIYNISTVKVTALGNGNYKQVRFPIKINLYGLVNPGPAVSYEKFCETMETDDQDWTYLGEMVNTFVEDGTSGYVKQTFNTALSGNPQMRLVKLNIYDSLSPTLISEIELLSNDAPQSQGNTPVLVDFPAEGRDAFLPLNIVANEIYAENRTSLAMGSHTGMRDAPFGWRRPLMEMINDDPSYMRSTGTACLNQIGTRALRLYDAWDVNYRSGIEWAKVFNHFNPDRPVVVPSSDDDYVFPYYDEIIDYCAESNYFCVIVLDTWYCIASVGIGHFLKFS